MRRIRCFVLLFCWFVAAEVVESQDCFVNTGFGKIFGTRRRFGHRIVNQFLGVRYAEPPLGELRFRKPLPYNTSKSAMDSNMNLTANTQFSYGAYPWYDNGTGQSEDCLYLNIWVPESTVKDKSKGKSVMFWVFGGGFLLGSVRDALYDAIALSAVGDVAVVTISYRLGSFGFFSSGTDDAPGNVGLYDLLLGLQWVKSNIRLFGGNPDSITLMGESSGARAVSILVFSPLAKGLFNRAILQSNSLLGFPFDNGSETINISQQVAKKLSCATDKITLHNSPKEVIACMKRVDAMRIAVATASISPNSSSVYDPQIDGDLIPENLYTTVKSGSFPPCDILTGINRDEGSFLLSTTYPDIFEFHGQKNTLINKTMGKQLAMKFTKELTDPEAAEDAYIDSVSDSDLQGIRHQTYTLIGDTVLTCPNVYLAEAFAEHGSDVYFYFFNHRSSTTPWASWQGVAHFEDVQFVFGNPWLYPEKYTDDERDLSLLMMNMWTKFAKEGCPELGWPRFTKKNPVVRVLDIPRRHQEKFGYIPSEHKCDFLKSFNPM